MAASTATDASFILRLSASQRRCLPSSSWHSISSQPSHDGTHSNHLALLAHAKQTDHGPNYIAEPSIMVAGRRAAACREVARCHHFVFWQIAFILNRAPAILDDVVLLSSLDFIGLHCDIASVSTGPSPPLRRGRVREHWHGADVNRG